MCTANKEESVQKQEKTNKIFHGVICNMITHIYFWFRTCLDMLVDTVLSFIWEGSRRAVPDLEKRHNILKESAVTLATKIRNKELKSAELVQACIERIKAVNPILNAVTDERFEAALKEASEVDQLIEKGLPDEYYKQKPFLGVPFTAKESHAVSGMRHTFGLTLRRNTRAAEDAECVRLLREAGAIPLAVTNVPEVNKWQETRNMLFGQTNNPYHTGRTVGGSSGGEAALMAAMATPIALCSDIGGSTRMPAFYCGLFALNPTAGHTNLRGATLRTGKEQSMASIGFVSRHCEDLAPLTAVVAGDKAPLLNMHRNVDIKDIKIYYVETSKDLRVSPICRDLKMAMSSVVARLTEQAPSPNSAPVPYYHDGLNYMFSLWKHWMTREEDSFPKLLANNQGEVNGLLELAKKAVGQSQYTLAAILKVLDEQVLPAVAVRWADELTDRLTADLTSLLGDNGVLLYPSAPQPAPYHYALLLRPFNFAYFAVFNAIKFPAVQVPVGVTSDGLPLGLQVVAAPRQEALCLAVARHLDQQFGGYVPPCRLIQ